MVDAAGVQHAHDLCPLELARLAVAPLALQLLAQHAGHDAKQAHLARAQRRLGAGLMQQRMP